MASAVAVFACKCLLEVARQAENLAQNTCTIQVEYRDAPNKQPSRVVKKQLPSQHFRTSKRTLKGTR